MDNPSRRQFVSRAGGMAILGAAGLPVSDHLRIVATCA